MQSKGIKVIPTVAWGEPNTFWFCFDGIEKGSPVAVSTLGVRTEKALFMQGYDEMLRKIKPSAIICYGKPFDEMKGKIIEVDYAEVNNLNKHFQNNSPVSLGPAQYDSKTDTYLKRVRGFICTDKGMGSASGGGNNSSSNPDSLPDKNPTDDKKIKLPEKDSQLKHIFRKTDGHLPDTLENRKLLEDVANNEGNYAGTDSLFRNQWYSELLSDGKQIWVKVRDRIIRNGGLNDPPRQWDPITGYDRNIRKWVKLLNLSSYSNKSFLSLYNYLEKVFRSSSNESLCDLVSDMCPYLFDDRLSADTAAYEDYEKFLDECLKNSKEEDVKTAFAASMKYLEFYRDEFGFEIDEIIKSLSIEEYEEYFNKLQQS